MRRAGARTTEAAARFRCEEGCGTMNQTPDHRSETAGTNRSKKRSALSVILYRSKKIIERRVPGIITTPAVEISISMLRCATTATLYGSIPQRASLFFWGKYDAHKLRPKISDFTLATKSSKDRVVSSSVSRRRMETVPSSTSFWPSTIM